MICGANPKKQKRQQPINQIISVLPCTRGRDRTGTSITSSVFETDASTNSATRAHSLYEHFF